MKVIQDLESFACWVLCDSDLSPELERDLEYSGAGRTPCGYRELEGRDSGWWHSTREILRAWCLYPGVAVCAGLKVILGALAVGSLV